MLAKVTYHWVCTGLLQGPLLVGVREGNPDRAFGVYCDWTSPYRLTRV